MAQDKVSKEYFDARRSEQAVGARGCGEPGSPGLWRYKALIRSHMAARQDLWLNLVLYNVLLTLFLGFSATIREVFNFREGEGRKLQRWRFSPRARGGGIRRGGWIREDPRETRGRRPFLACVHGACPVPGTGRPHPPAAREFRGPRPTSSLEKVGHFQAWPDIVPGRSGLLLPAAATVAPREVVVLDLWHPSVKCAIFTRRVQDFFGSLTTPGLGRFSLYLSCLTFVEFLETQHLFSNLGIFDYYTFKYVCPFSLLFFWDSGSTNV